MRQPVVGSGIRCHAKGEHVLETQLELLDKIGVEKYGQLNSASADEAE